MSSNVRAEYRLIHPAAKLPFRKRETDAGYDLYSVEDVILQPGDSMNVCTGIQISVPSGWYYNIKGRSSMWLAKILTFSGTVDSGYTDVIYVGLYNIGKDPYTITIGQRIAQLIPRKIYTMEYVKVQTFSPEYNSRGTDGWGSSGR